MVLLSHEDSSRVQVISIIGHCELVIESELLLLASKLLAGFLPCLSSLLRTELFDFRLEDFLVWCLQIEEIRRCVHHEVVFVFLDGEFIVMHHVCKAT